MTAHDAPDLPEDASTTGESEGKERTYRFGPVDLVQMRLLGQLPPHKRVRAMLDARELAVGLIRGRLRRLYPDLSLRELNMKVLEEIERRDRLEFRRLSEEAALREVERDEPPTSAPI
ncbi:MAG: hypothetical protein IT330_01985 [Anaerolineae bacterium]|nr:hypothetical protein [Anaerolineae bacterium]